MADYGQKQQKEQGRGWEQRVGRNPSSRASTLRPRATIVHTSRRPRASHVAVSPAGCTRGHRDGVSRVPQTLQPNPLRLPTAGSLTERLDNRCRVRGGAGPPGTDGGRRGGGVGEGPDGCRLRFAAEAGPGQSKTTGRGAPPCQTPLPPLGIGTAAGGEGGAHPVGTGVGMGPHRLGYGMWRWGTSAGLGLGNDLSAAAAGRAVGVVTSSPPPPLDPAIFRPQSPKSRSYP